MKDRYCAAFTPYDGYYSDEQLKAMADHKAFKLKRFRNRMKHLRKLDRKVRKI
ncbi:MAG: hypothetical protein KAS39_05265 [Actinomycetia bacterium]|nr:hypothetical protein [Actinomycetes bacterium]